MSPRSRHREQRSMYAQSSCFTTSQIHRYLTICLQHTRNLDPYYSRTVFNLFGEQQVHLGRYSAFSKNPVHRFTRRVPYLLRLCHSIESVLYIYTRAHFITFRRLTIHTGQSLHTNTYILWFANYNISCVLNKSDKGQCQGRKERANTYPEYN